MEIQTGALVIVLAYMVGMMIIGYVVGKINIKGSADYLVAGRRMGLFMVAFSLSANNIGGGSTTGLAQKAFGAWGVSAIWYVLAASLAMIPLAYFAPKIRKTMAVTIPEVVGRRFGKLSSNFTAVLSVLSLFCLTSSQIGASGAVINALIPTIPLNVCLLLAGCARGGNLRIRIYRSFAGKAWWNLNHSLIDGHSHRIQVMGVCFQPKTLRLERNRTAACKGVKKSRRIIIGGFQNFSFCGIQNILVIPVAPA